MKVSEWGGEKQVYEWKMRREAEFGVRGNHGGTNKLKAQNG
jgi:hypothetical protein